MKQAFERIYLEKFVIDKLNQGIELKTKKERAVK